MTREEAKALLLNISAYDIDTQRGLPKQEAIEMAIKALEQEPCDVSDTNVGKIDAISRQAAIEKIHWLGLDNDTAIKCDLALRALPSVNPQEPKTEQFAKWVATEIFDDMWEYNKDAFGEITCRKLAKLGIVRAKGDVWELVEPQESEEQSNG